ncbi:metal-dependent hydrolase [Novosphingobium malaysiense]|uniref:Metal-dependent hydrolase n=1 Tax=Novosphingobium malaysiense TaxID=1348853 RepID=A0A0B1ZH37_9SPHN|nr:metal-dependent hydrolase [Novosphingobium malaysiense]KHK89827.1 hypothetical protein LK12_18080 [Novosphingobium malaysiense]
MQVRRPKFDFTSTPAHWAANPEFAQYVNAPSVWIPSLERFLNRVLTRASRDLGDTTPEERAVKQDIKIFIRQESVHLATHEAFNEVLSRSGYDIEPFVDEAKAEFDRLYETKSLGFLCAYCEGFETMGPPGALAWLDEMEDLLEGADAEVVRLWKWHLMEEYEHRTVCHDVFHAVHGGYFLRVYGFWFQFFQLSGFTRKVMAHLLERDRAAMSPAEVKASKRRLRRVTWRLGLAMAPRLLKAMLPWYTPRKVAEPKMFRSYRDSIEARLA